MMRPQILLLVISFSFQTAFSQSKTVKGDTSYWVSRDRQFRATLDLKDLATSTNEFDFRFSYFGQIIEIAKDSNGIKGDVVNYIYHTRNHKTETLFDKLILSPEKAKHIYELIINSELLALPSDKDIKKWKQGADGITYTVEYADKNNYWHKNYWTPSSQDSIPEAMVIRGVIKMLSDSLNLEKAYTTFKDGLPKFGCYSSGGIVKFCYISNSFQLGYSGATKLPLGFYTSYSASYIGKANINSGIALQYNTNGNEFHHLDLAISKWDILYKGSSFSDFMIYNYQNRKVDMEASNSISQDHQITYGFNLKRNIAVGAGIDYLLVTDRKLGSHLYAYKYFSKPIITTELSSSIFNNGINYKAQIIKSFYIERRSLLRAITLGIAYENFMGYKDLYFNTKLLF